MAVSLRPIIAEAGFQFRKIPYVVGGGQPTETDKYLLSTDIHKYLLSVEIEVPTVN